MVDKHKEIIDRLDAAIDVEEDNREMVKEADEFLNTRGGQWEDFVLSSWDKRPRYTFDQCNPVVDSIMGDMEETDFAIQVLPKGGGTTKESAEQYEGLIRNTESISGARFIYNDAARIMAGTGLSGWRIKQAFRDSDSFQQDLLIDSISNFKERVWFDPGAVKQTMEDANECWVLTELSMDDYKHDFPKGSKASIGSPITNNRYYYKKEGVLIGEWFHRKETSRELALLSNNQVVVVDEKFDSVRDEMFAKGITVEQTRVRKAYTVYQRLFDGKDFLTKDNKTVFEFLPIIPCYANFRIMENKVTYWGAIEKLMDPQRVLNYAESKKIAESALKPIEKVWMTTDQAKGSAVKADLETQNTNNKPIQLYTHVDGQLPPFKPQANQPDSVLIETATSASAFIDKAANLYDAQKGIGLAGQAEETIRLLQNKGSSTNFKYFKSIELALTHTARILVKSYPKVYATRQELRILNADGSFSSFVTKDVIIDEQTRKPVEINDLAQGQYDVVCKSGPAYYTKQQETVKSLLEAGQVDPSVIQIGSDILLSNIPSPGMDKVAERKRRQLFQSGVLPEDQLTEEELKEVEASKSAPKEPDAAVLLAQAEMKKADADVLKEQLTWKKVQMEIELKQSDQYINTYKASTERMKIQLDAKRLGLSIPKTEAETVGVKLDNQSKVIDMMTRKSKDNNAVNNES